MTNNKVQKESLWYDVPSDKVPFIKDAMPKEKYDLLISSLLMRVKEFYKDKKKRLRK